MEDLENRYHCEECGGTFDDNEDVWGEVLATVDHSKNEERIQPQQFDYFHEDCWMERHGR